MNNINEKILSHIKDMKERGAMSAKLAKELRGYCHKVSVELIALSFSRDPQNIDTSLQNLQQSSSRLQARAVIETHHKNIPHNAKLLENILLLRTKIKEYKNYKVITRILGF